MLTVYIIHAPEMNFVALAFRAGYINMGWFADANS